MGRKGKRRKRPAAARPQPMERPTEEELAPVSDDEAPVATAEEEPAPRPPGLFGGAGVPSPYPSLVETVRHAARPVGSDPLLLAVTFLFLLALWGLFAALGRPPSPPQMALFMAHPPISVFSDAILSLSVIPGSFASLGIVIGVTAVRSVVLVFLLSRLVPRLGGEPVPLDRAGIVRRTMSMFAVNAAGLGIVLSGLLVLSGFLGQLFAFVLVSGLGLYFLAMAPIVVVAEDASAAEALRRSVRAGRLPGMRHVGLVMLYLVLILWLVSISPTGPLPPATPSLLVWVVALVETFAHLLLLGAFAYRWIVVRDEVPAGPAKRRRRP